MPEVGVSEEGCYNRLPVKFQDVKFTVTKCKHEIFVRIDMKHSCFSNYFIICLQSIIEIIIVNSKNG